LSLLSRATNDILLFQTHPNPNPNRFCFQPKTHSTQFLWFLTEMGAGASTATTKTISLTDFEILAAEYDKEKSLGKGNELLYEHITKKYTQLKQAELTSSLALLSLQEKKTELARRKLEFETEQIERQESAKKMKEEAILHSELKREEALFELEAQAFERDIADALEAESKGISILKLRQSKYKKILFHPLESSWVSRSHWCGWNSNCCTDTWSNKAGKHRHSSSFSSQGCYWRCCVPKTFPEQRRHVEWSNADHKHIDPPHEPFCVWSMVNTDC
jgi:hypothetical protein